MDSVTIEWSNPIRYDRLENSRVDALGYSGFYMIIEGVLDSNTRQYTDFELLYIGQAYRQNIIVRIQQDHQADDCIDEFLNEFKECVLFVKAGLIVEMSQERDSQPLFNDIECCLIFRNQPICNTMCKDSYNGRDIKIENTGNYEPLKRYSRC